jgi:hypothetical protein
VDRVRCTGAGLGNSLDRRCSMAHYRPPMARKFSTEQTQRGYAHAVLGMPACLSGRSLLQARPACADCGGGTPHPGAEVGKPGMSW